MLSTWAPPYLGDSLGEFTQGEPCADRGSVEGKQPIERYPIDNRIIIIDVCT
jgi:hypothetical protein